VFVTFTHVHPSINIVDKARSLEVPAVSCKHSSLQHHGSHYSRRKFWSTCTRGDNPTKLFLIRNLHIFIIS